MTQIADPAEFPVCEQRVIVFTSQRRAPDYTRRGVLSLTGAAVALPLLAACSGRQEASPPAAAKKLSGTVEFWTNPTYAYAGHSGEQFVKEFQQANPGVTVAFADTPGTLADKLLTNAAAGTMPDISYLDRFNTKSFGCRGILRPLDDYVKTARNVKPANFWPLLVKDVTFNGKLCAVPHGPTDGVLYYNKGIFKESGLDPEKPPATWDAALTAVQRLTKRNGTTTERVGWPPQRGYGVPWMVPYWQLGGELVSPDEKTAVFNNDKAQQVFDWFLKIYDAQGGDAAVNEAFGSLNQFDAFGQGKTAMVWASNAQYHLTWEKITNLEVGFTSWPTPPGGQRSNYMGGWSLVIPAAAKNPDVAFAFLDYISADDPQIRFADEWNTVPTTKTSAQSDKFLQNRGDRKAAVADMATAKWVITAPGGDKALAPSRAFADQILQKKVSIRDGLAQAVRDVQAELDVAQRQCGS